jgi:hypothetical protein
LRPDIRNGGKPLPQFVDAHTAIRPAGRDGADALLWNLQAGSRSGVRGPAEHPVEGKPILEVLLHPAPVPKPQRHQRRFCRMEGFRSIITASTR